MSHPHGKAAKRPERSHLLIGGGALLLGLLLLLRTDVLRGASTRLLEAAGPGPCPDGSVECAMARVRRAQMLLDDAKAQAAAILKAQGKTQLDAQRVAGGAQQLVADAAQAQAQAQQAPEQAPVQPKQPQPQAQAAPELRLSDGEAAAEATEAAEAQLGEWESEWHPDSQIEQRMREVEQQQPAAEPQAAAQQEEAQEQQAEPAEQPAEPEQQPQESQPAPAQEQPTAEAAAGAEAAAPTGKEGQPKAPAQQAQQAQADGSGSKSPYLQALEGCQDVACLTRAEAEAARQPGQYRFPHWFIVGWQKCATTSLYHHLKEHPQVLRSVDKEPEFFSDTCGYDPGACPPKEAKDYLWRQLRLGEYLAAGGAKAAMEASTHYGREGVVLAPRLVKAFPWLKVVMSMREPISRAISMLAHNLDKSDKGCLTHHDVFWCLRRDLQAANYSAPLQAWLGAYPPEQLYLVQYENITSTAHMADVLHDLKRFLKVHPHLPSSDLGLRNTREEHLERKGRLEDGQEADGWPMQRWQYRTLVDLVRPDAQKVAELADRHGLADGSQWMRNWEEHWQATLNECDAEGSCVVYPN